jgi:hypothetical protein
MAEGMFRGQMQLIGSQIIKLRENETSCETNRIDS